jgi:hypothetical protein
MLVYEIGIGAIEMVIFIFAINDENKFLDQSIFVNLGWFIIIMNFFIIGVYIFLDIRENIRRIVKIIKKVLRRSKLSSNPLQTVEF